MLLVRPVALKDLDDIVELASYATYGLTTLPKDRTILQERIESSIRTFQFKKNKPGGELYLFALEDTEIDKVIGISAIVSKLGGFEPFYAYRITTKTHKSIKLNITQNHRVLELVEDHNGPSEIGSLFVHPRFRESHCGKLLSLTRFMVMAQHPNLFEPVVIAEMRGFVDKNGESPFWEALGRRFFKMDYAQADYLSIVDKSFIAELMPKYPIYIDILPLEAQEMIGLVHPNTEPALRILKKEGFQQSGMVDIFEGGPIISCDRNNIKSVRETKSTEIIFIKKEVKTNNNAILMNTYHSPAASIAKIDILEEGIVVEKRTAELLNLSIGNRCSYLIFS